MDVCIKVSLIGGPMEHSSEANNVTMGLLEHTLSITCKFLGRQIAMFGSNAFNNVLCGMLRLESEGLKTSWYNN